MGIGELGRYLWQPRRGDFGPCFKARARVHFKGGDIGAIQLTRTKNWDKTLKRQISDDGKKDKDESSALNKVPQKHPLSRKMGLFNATD